MKLNNIYKHVSWMIVVLSLSACGSQEGSVASYTPDSDVQACNAYRYSHIPKPVSKPVVCVDGVEYVESEDGSLQPLMGAL